MNWQIHCLAVLFLALFPGFSLEGQETDFAKRLKWGEFQVGFKSEIVMDHSRTYSCRFGDSGEYGIAVRRPRPIVVNMWYPAVSNGTAPQTPMPYRTYLQLQSELKDVQEWANSLSNYACDVISGEIFGKPVAKLDDLELRLWNHFLDTPTHVIKDAEPHSGSFPVLIYHSGAGSSFEDNSLFCEFMASSGYVVIGSAYQTANGTSFGVDGKDGSVRDMEFLSRLASSLDFANWNQICFAGHSLGAQSSLRATIRPDCPASVLMLLDTTVDYYSLATPTFEYLTKPVLENVDNIKQPMFVATGKGALFQLCDQLVNSERTYCTIPKLNHNEYISQGIFRLQILEKLVAERTNKKFASELKSAEEVRTNYVALCHLCRAYLNDRFKSGVEKFQSEASNFIEQHDRNRISVETIRSGQSMAEEYSADSGKPPTPRQLKPLLDRIGVVEFCNQLAKFKISHPESPIFESNMLMSAMLYDLAIASKMDDARYLHQQMKIIGSDGVSTIRFLAFMCEVQKKSDLEQYFLEMALSIDPSDQTALQKIELLKARRKEKTGQSADNY